MRTIPAALQAKLDAGTANLCWCFKLTLTDGTVMGFTDHDRALTVASVVYDPSSGFAASEAKSALGLAIDNLEVFGALSSARIQSGDVQAGRYDNAAVEVMRVDWEDPTLYVVVQAGNLGEVRRGRTAFEAEVRGRSHTLNQPVGDSYMLTCGAKLGDGRCGVDLDAAAYKGSGTVAALVSDRAFTAGGLSSFSAGLFTYGILTFTSGANANRSFDVKSHADDGGTITLELWDAPPDAIASSDAFTIVAGCDKRLATCRDTFSNLVNFRGFGALMPGDDSVVRVAKRGGDHTGGSLIGGGDGEGVYFDS